MLRCSYQEYRLTLKTTSFSKTFSAKSSNCLMNMANNSGKELFAMFDSLRKEKAEAAILKEKQEITLGEFIKEVIEELRHPVKRKPSSNFQPYTTLLHKLEREGKIIKNAISKVNRHSFVQFSEWILRQKGLKGSGN